SLSTRVATQSPTPALVAQVAHNGRIHSMSYSGDGRLLATAGSDRTIKLWDVARGLLIRTFEGHSGEVRSVVFNGNGDRVLSASADGTLRIGDVMSGRVTRTITGDRTASMAGAAFGANDREIVSAQFVEGDQAYDPRSERLIELAVWNVDTGRKIRSART